MNSNIALIHVKLSTREGHQGLMKTILIIDTYQIYLYGLCSILKDKYELNVFSDFKSIPITPSDLLVFGFSVDHFDPCLEVVSKCNIPLLAVVDDGSKPVIKDLMFEARPNSYLHRSSLSATVLNAVKTTLKGESFVDSRVSPLLLDVFRDETNNYTLTNQENAVLKLALKGLSNREIARNLVISLPTVKYHLKNIYKKTNVANRKQLIALFAKYPFIGV